MLPKAIPCNIDQKSQISSAKMLSGGHQEQQIVRLLDSPSVSSSGCSSDDFRK